MTDSPRPSSLLTRRAAGMLVLSGCAAAVVKPLSARGAARDPSPAAGAGPRRIEAVGDRLDLDIGGTTYRAQSANRYPDYPAPWALERFEGTDEFRFELREGDRWAGDRTLKPPRNRVEMQQRDASLPRSGEAIWFADTIAVETDEAPRSPWTIVNQLHSSINGVNPLVFTVLVGAEMRIHTAFDGKPVAKPGRGRLCYADPAFERRRYTRLVYRVVMGEGTGELAVWRDGKPIVQETGQNIGYPNDPRCRPHLKWGQYRRADAQTYALRHANVEGATLASLEPRVKDPKPLRDDPLIALPLPLRS